MFIPRTFAKRIANYGDPQSIGAKLRAKRLGPLISMIDTTFTINQHVRIIDIGGTRLYWKILPNQVLEKKNVHITIVNLPGSAMPEDEERFRFVEADGCDLSMFGDDSFHIAHSNSVIEHVGDWNRMVQFAKEVSRVAPKYFVQTPNYWFPVEPHAMVPFFHWLPKPIRVLLMLNVTLGHWGKTESIDSAVRTVESARLVDKRMFRGLFPEAEIMTERYFFLPKSFVAIRR